jgi:hypothetical protein
MVKVNTDFEKLQLKARDALYFIDSHPAINGSFFGVQTSLWFSIQTVCKRGHSEYSIKDMTIYYSKENYKKFKKEFDKEIAEDQDYFKKCPTLVSIQMPYQKVFGEPWIFDHIEYWGELTLHIYKGKKAKEKFNFLDWDNWEGPHAGGRTYEEMIINLAKKMKKECGNFDYYSFLTPEEIKNHKEEEVFFWKKVPDTKEHKNYSTIIPNKKYIKVSDAEKNLRWQEWMKIKKNISYNN